MKKLTLVVLLCMLMAISSAVVACHKHKYSDEWSSDDTHHWHYATCEHEFEIRDRAEHSYGQDNICIICNRVKQSADPDHQHTYSEDWDSDENHHWHYATCEHKDIIKDRVRHSYDADYVCIDCGYEHEHTFNTYWSRDNTYHWYDAACGHKDVIDKIEHNYDEDNRCIDCGYTHQHIYSQAWSYDETHHWHAAACEHEDEISDKTTHDFIGNKCSECGYEKD